MAHFRLTIHIINKPNILILRQYTKTLQPLLQFIFPQTNRSDL